MANDLFLFYKIGHGEKMLQCGIINHNFLVFAEVFPGNHHDKHLDKNF